MCDFLAVREAPRDNSNRKLVHMQPRRRAFVLVFKTGPAVRRPLSLPHIYIFFLLLSLRQISHRTRSLFLSGGKIFIRGLRAIVRLYGTMRIWMGCCASTRLRLQTFSSGLLVNVSIRYGSLLWPVLLSLIHWFERVWYSKDILRETFLNEKKKNKIKC